MRRLQPKPKERQRVTLPSELVDAMREVQWRIEEVRRDPHVNIDYDDAIQVGPLCGGRYQRKPSRFEFRYRSSGGQGERWNLTLFDFDIEDISSGHLQEMTLYCCATPGCGFKANTLESHCDCDYFKDPDFGAFEFPEALDKLAQRGVTGISESSTCDDVLRELGVPDEKGGDVTRSIGYIWPWIKYHRKDCQLRFEFGESQRIRNITVLDKDWKPGTNPRTSS